MKILVIILALIVGGVGYVAHSFGIIGLPKPRDLGVTYTQADTDSALKKNKVEREDILIGESPSQSIGFSGSHEVNDTFNSAELTGLANERSWVYLPFRNLQIKLHDGGAEISGNLDTSKLINYLQAVGGMTADEAAQVKKYVPIDGKPSFYVNVDGHVEDNDLSLNVNQVSIGAFSVPGSIISSNQARVNQFLESRARQWEGLSINSLSVSGDELKFDGTLPNVARLAR